MDHIESSHPHTAAAATMPRLRAEIIEDRETLERLLERLDHGTNAPRRAMAWLTEKMVELKLLVDDPGDGHFRLLESIELLSLGIEGKILLWHALSAVTSHREVLGTHDFGGLVARARAQRDLLEPLRLDAAEAVFRD